MSWRDDLAEMERTGQRCRRCGTVVLPASRKARPFCAACATAALIEKRRQDEQDERDDARHGEAAWIYRNLQPQQQHVVNHWFATRTDELRDVARNRGIKSRCSKYGLTIGEWLVMVAEQRSRCAICDREKHPLKLCIDHDHYGLHVRGLLCGSCNTGLGLLGIDGPEAENRAKSVSSYLRRVRNQTVTIGRIEQVPTSTAARTA